MASTTMSEIVDFSVTGANQGVGMDDDGANVGAAVAPDTSDGAVSTSPVSTGSAPEPRGR